MGCFKQKVVCKYVHLWLVLVVCDVVCGNCVIKINIKKSAEICGNLGSGSWTRTSDIRINSYELVGQKVPDFCGFAEVFMVYNEIPYVKCMF